MMTVALQSVGGNMLATVISNGGLQYDYRTIFRSRAA